MPPMLKTSGTYRLKLNHDKLLSNCAFSFNLRRYNKARKAADLLISSDCASCMEVGPSVTQPIKSVRSFDITRHH